MKVSFITNTFPALTETFVVREVRELNADVITTSFEKKFKEIFELDGIKVDEVKDPYYKVYRKYKNFLYKVFNIYKFDWREGQYKHAKRILNKNKPDLLFGVFGQNGIVASKLSKDLDIPYIIQLLGVDASKFLNYSNYTIQLVKSINSSKFSIALSNEMKNDLVAVGADSEKIIVHNIGVPTRDFKQLKLNEKTFCKFLAVGRMVEKKSPISTIKAFEFCAEQNSNVSLEFVGNGPLFEDSKNYVDKSRFKNRIRLHGYKTIEEIYEITKGCHVFVQHSITSEDGDKEGWPVAIAEACSYGLPIISTKHSGIKEQVIDGYNGYLVEENDIKSMAKYMVKLSNDFEKCVNFGNNSRRYIEKKGDLSIQIKKLKSLIIER